ncbi:internal scaffolding protein [Blackfly microvirus SF02]|uniref:Internal scaffolding protein n=1 Tax=Blackfly microvirus SF02 TaxID=2576452 RepID=A0A4P8PK96_9VIRU|nr:internal scaffolding protein [Blackfly microvirus SF02]
MRTETITVDDDGVIYKTFQAFFKTPYNHDTDAESNRTGQANNEPTKTQQHLRDETDINLIVKAYGITGQLPLVNKPPLYGDYTNVLSYEDAQNLIAEANAEFFKLPAEIRSQFQNDPGRWTAEVQQATDNNDDRRLRDIGLAVKLSERAPDPQNGGTPPVPVPEPPKGPL